MTDVYTQENASKKKFLAPVLVILLCMVSLTAAGYAYSATVDNTDDPVIIDGITMEISGLNTNNYIFEVDDIHIATHTTNGKAIYYNGTINGIDNPGFNAAGTAVSEYTDSFTGFGDGYYVQVIKDTTDVGYHATPVVDADLFEDADALADAGIIKISEGPITLEIVNHSKKTVDIKTTLSAAVAVTDKAISDVYIVIKNGSEVVGFESYKTAGETVIATALEDNQTGTYTVEAYIALTDYLSANVPGLPADAYKFAVSFETVEHVATP